MLDNILKQVDYEEACPHCASSLPSLTVLLAWCFDEHRTRARSDTLLATVSLVCGTYARQYTDLQKRLILNAFIEA